MSYGYVSFNTFSDVSVDELYAMPDVEYSSLNGSLSSVWILSLFVFVWKLELGNGTGTDGKKQHILQTMWQGQVKT